MAKSNNNYDDYLDVLEDDLYEDDNLYSEYAKEQDIEQEKELRRLDKQKAIRMNASREKGNFGKNKGNKKTKRNPSFR
jgi:hypothetical protein